MVLSPEPTIFKALPRTVWVLGFASLLTDVSSEMVHAVLPLFLVSGLGATILTVGLIEGLAESTASILKVFSGALSDYIGNRKRLVVGGYSLSALSKVLFGLAATPALVLAARVCDRIGKGLRVAPRDALVADATEPAVRGAAYGLRQSLDTIGACAGPIIATAVMLWSANNYRLIFWLAFIPGALSVVLLLLEIKEPKRKAHQTNPLSWAALRSLGKEYWVLVLVALVFNLGNSSDAFILLKAVQVGIAAWAVPVALVVINIAYALSAFPVGVLSDRIGRDSLLIGSFFLYCVVYMGFAFAGRPWQMWILLGVYGLHLGMSQGILLALVSDSVPEDRRGTAFGFVNLVTGAALLPASLVAGVLWQKFGPAAAFLFGSAFAACAAALLIGATSRSRNATGT